MRDSELYQTTAARTVEALRAVPVDSIPDVTLGRGLVGITLGFADPSRPPPQDAAQSIEALLDAAEQRIQSLGERLPIGLYSGLTGVDWTFRAWATCDAVSTADEGVQAESNWSAALLDILSRPWDGTFDLIGGLVGLGVHALGEPDDILRDALVRRLLDLLIGSARETDEGMAWFSNPGTGSIIERTHPSGYFDLGLAHGAAGVVCFLAAAAESGFADAAEACERAAVWLAGRRSQPPTTSSLYPAVWDPAARPASSRLAWCYGDLPVAVALLRAGSAIDRADLVAEATDVLLHCARRPLGQSGVQDAGLCHGAAGVGHLLYWSGVELKRADIVEGAEWWLSYAARSATEAGGLPFTTFDVDPKGEPSWTPQPGFLVGNAGVAAALGAATEPSPPTWHTLLVPGSL